MSSENLASRERATEEKQPWPCLCLAMTPKGLPQFFGLLQNRFFMKLQVGHSVRDVLCRQLELDSDYVDRKVQTIFLDGKTVDDMEGSRVGNGSTLALSAAMPGLAGATLRRGGFYSAMRSGISHGGEGRDDGESREGVVTLKLFNLLVEELGTRFLMKGIGLPREDLEQFLRARGDGFVSQCLWAKYDDEAIIVEALPGRSFPPEQETIRLTVTIESEEPSGL